MASITSRTGSVLLRAGPAWRGQRGCRGPSSLHMSGSGRGRPSPCSPCPAGSQLCTYVIHFIPRGRCSFHPVFQMGPGRSRDDPERGQGVDCRPWEGGARWRRGTLSHVPVLVARAQPPAPDALPGPHSALAFCSLAALEPVVRLSQFLEESAWAPGAGRSGPGAAVPSQQPRRGTRGRPLLGVPGSYLPRPQQFAACHPQDTVLSRM